MLSKAVDECVIDCNTKKYCNHNRYKQYFLADSGYDSKKNFKKLEDNGYIPIIKQNKRNIKNRKLIRKMNTKQKNIYKKRIVIENYHSWIKKFSKIKSLYERNIVNYRGLLLLGISVIIHRRIVKNTIIQISKKYFYLLFSFKIFVCCSFLIFLWGRLCHFFLCF